MKLMHVSIAFGLAMASAGATLYVAANRPPEDTSGILMQPRHPVTKEMWQATGEMSNVQAPSFELVDTKGAKHSLASLTEKPLFLYFVLEGCPCSIDAEPLFQRLHKHHDGRVNFMSVTNAGKQLAEKWTKDWAPPYPVASDAKLKTMEAYKAERSVYCALISKDGEVIKMWPGYSASMLQEASKLMSKLTGEKDVPFDALYAPKEMTSGCSFEGGVGS